ncbi:MAG: N-acetylglucosamine-6-phosphate deacetylase, partial [Planctomycetota bacterium]
MKVPGLIDLQVNGFEGVDFSSPDLTQDDFVTSRAILEKATAAFLPTLVTSPKEIYRRNLPIIAKAAETEEFKGRILGVHLEGPFISGEEGARGSHNRHWISRPDIKYLSELVELAAGKVKMITIAADVGGAEELAHWCCEHAIVVSLGHHLAGRSDLERLVRAGAKALTHLGNGVPANMPRHDNPIWAGLANDRLYATMITDGHHLPASLLKTFIRAKGVSRCIVISDSSSLAGMPPGRYTYWGTDVALDQTGRVYSPSTGYLAGSSATMFDCMNHLASLNLLSAH